MSARHRYCLYCGYGLHDTAECPNLRKHVDTREARMRQMEAELARLREGARIQRLAHRATVLTMLGVALMLAGLAAYLLLRQLG